MRHKPLQVLHIKAIDAANVREIEPDGTILKDIRFVGKQFDNETNTWVPVSEGVVLPYSARLVNQLKLGTLIPADMETARIAGVKFNKGQ
jgi:hypothetical protein